MPRPVRISVLIASSLTLVSVLVLSGGWLAARQSPPPGVDPALLSTYKWRSVGPDRGGRSIAVSGVKGRPNEAYFGATGGGLWKTTDRGITWAPVTDGQIKSASVGAVAVSETNPDLVYIGMGESCIRGNVMEGDGIYKSTDAGKTWSHVAFPDVRVISRIRIHPTNPDIVYVAAFGRLSLPSEERGVYKTTDGGRTWRRVLFKDPRSGGVDLSIDRKNPNVIYAALWEAYRLEYQMSSGGAGSGLHKSTDGGETWKEITRNPGMPAGVVGRIGVDVSGGDSNRVYALIENENGGLFRSDDAGATWTLVNSTRDIRQRAFYYTHVHADPAAKDNVYLLNVGAFRSTDGGKTLTSWRASHGDNHDLWIDPDDPKHWVEANDGGGNVSYDAGATFTAGDYPTAQYYHVVATAHQPYHICGAQQDGSTVCLPSTTNLGGGGGGGRGAGGGGAGGGGGRGGGPAAPVMYSPGGSEDGYIAPDPKDPDVFYSGGNNGTFMDKINRRTGERREVHPYPRMFSGEPSSALVERIQWTYPIIFSPVDPNVLYTATQHVWRTTNGGQTWDKLGDDKLTRHDPKTMGDSGGPITKDMNSPEVYATVFAIGPGKTDVNVIWAGSDDGVVSVTRDAGKTWATVTPKDMPDFGRVSIIDASMFDAGSAYIAVKRPLLGDMAPYIFRTHDFGKTWTKIVNGLGPLDYVHVVREDPKRKGLLYAGTQHAVYYSYDDGDTWRSLSLNLPDVPIADLVVSPNANDLAIATHGRSFYILDNIGPLRQYGTPAAAATDVFLFQPDDAIRSAGGATITYWVKRAPEAPPMIEILDAKGGVIRTFGAPAPAAPAGAQPEGQGRGGGRGAGGGGGNVGTSIGLNSVTWDLRYPSATGFPGMILWGGGLTGPLAAPGTYQVRMTIGGRVQTQPLVVKRNPLFVGVSDGDLKEQFDLLIQIRDKTSEANNSVVRIRNLKSQVVDRLGKVPGDTKLNEAGTALTAALSAVEGEIYQVKNQAGQDPLNFPIKINNRLASLLSMVGRGDGKPVGNAPVIFKDLVAELKVQTDRLGKVLVTELTAFNTEAKRLGLEEVK